MKRKIGILFMAVAILAVGSITTSAQVWRDRDFEKHRGRSGRVYVVPERNYGWDRGYGRDRGWDNRWERRREERWERRREPRIRVVF